MKSGVARAYQPCALKSRPSASTFGKLSRRETRPPSYFLLLLLILLEPLIASPHSAGQPPHSGACRRPFAGVARYSAANRAECSTPRSASRNVTLPLQRSVRRSRRAGNGSLSSVRILSGLRLALPGQKECGERRDDECESDASPEAA
jgi:hypothetical protein